MRRSGLLPSPFERGRAGDGGDTGSGWGARRQLPPPAHPHPSPLDRRRDRAFDFDRRSLVFAGIGLSVAGSAFAGASPFAAIETRAQGRLGVMALDVVTGRRLAYRADERFPMCSTFKLLLAAFVLARVEAGRERLDRRIAYTAADLMDYAPAAKAHLAEGAMTVAELCAAAIQLSDNTAANLLLRETGGPAALTAWLRRIGDPATRLDNNEPALNVWSPGEVHDTSTPAAMTATLRRLLIGEGLSLKSRALLVRWMEGATTGLKRLRAGLPSGWRAGDKTGTWSDGPRGTANDIAILWPPKGGPILVTAYLCDAAVAGEARDAALAEVGRKVVEAFSRG